MSGWKTLVSAETLAIALQRADVVVVDCRHWLDDPGHGQQSWRSSHVPGAVHAHLDRDLSDTTRPAQGRHPLPDAERFCASLSEWGITPKHQVVAYDQRDGAMAAARLWFMLRLLGHERVAVLDGGFDRWSALGLPVSTQATPRVGGYYTGRYDSARLIDSAEVCRCLNDPGRTPGWLIDARAAERFRGEVEPVDRRPGHVPGAVNRPWTDNLTPDGRFRTPVELAAAFRALAGDRAASELAVMCGSGVTACHHLLAMERAGLYGARLYAESWSGWIADPSRPVAVASTT